MTRECERAAADRQAPEPEVRVSAPPYIAGVSTALAGTGVRRLHRAITELLGGG